MEYLESLLTKLKFTSNRNRTNLVGETMYYGSRKCLVKGIYSNTRRQGGIFEHVRSMRGPDINAVCINRNVVCGPHRDKKKCNVSYICFLGNFSGGALIFLRWQTVRRKMRRAWPVRWCSDNTLERATRRLEVFRRCLYFESASNRFANC